MHATPDFDVIVIGGGPAGSATATLLADSDRRVLLLEREVFPRFKVGESLIPGTWDVLQRLGMLEKLRSSHFVKKHSVQFYGGSGKPSAPFYFKEIDPSERSQTWQVLRSEFDQMLLDNARQHGVQAEEGVQVKDVLFENGRAVGVRAVFPLLNGLQNSKGSQREASQRETIQNNAATETRELRCRVVVDATGQRAMLARKLDLRESDPRLRMAALFAHFEGGHRDQGIDEGATLILHTESQDSWFWYIPLPENRVSVGVVGPIPHLIHGRQGKPEQTFEEEIQRCPGLKPRLENANRVSDVHVQNDFSYVTREVAGEGWMLVGDACGFLDPMYSSGVLLALKSAELAADTLNAAFDDDDLSAARLTSYGPRFKSGLGAFRQLVYAFYTPGFSFATFLRRFPKHRLAVIYILQGDVFDRDFDSLFQDLEKMLAESPQPRPPRHGSSPVPETI
jgi:flavin-dependent dehydrogenase